MTHLSLTSGDQRLHFEQAADGLYDFHLELLKTGGWSMLSRGNALVSGTSFTLRPTAVQKISEDRLEVSGEFQAWSLASELLTVPFSGAVTLDRASDWMTVTVDVDAPHELRLQMVGGTEPELLLQLGELPPYDRGDHVWFKTHVDHPTRWNGEAQGNDLPALYYYDSYHQHEVLMFFNMTEMTWMGRENIARFLNYRCGYRRSYRGSPTHHLGLHANGFSGTVFPAGRQRFAYSLQARPRSEPPTEATALTRLIDACLHLLPTLELPSGFPAKATTWTEVAERCASELQDEQCWGRNTTLGEFILNYVGGYSPAWEEAFAAKGQTIDFKAVPCLDSAAFIGYPLAIVQALDSGGPYRALYRRVKAYTAAHLNSAFNPYVERTGVTGTWQHLYVLEQLLAAAYVQGDRPTQKMLIQNVHDIVMPLAHGTAYLFPLSFSRATLQAAGSGQVIAVAGLYAWLMLTLFEHEGQEDYLHEARQALIALANAPMDHLPQEAFLLSVGAQAAHKLAHLTGETRFDSVHAYLLAQNLRMMYWYNDATRPEYAGHNILGMFQACSPMLYPAFFENVECVSRLASTLGHNPVPVGLLIAFDCARKHNFYMLPYCLPPERRTSNLEFIPLENLGVLEDEKTGWIGQEIYGCGQIFQAYLLWEAYVRSHNREVMVLNTSSYRTVNANPIHETTMTFILFNPTHQPQDTRLSFPAQPIHRAAVGSSPQTLENVSSPRHLDLCLGAQEVQYLTIQF